MDARKKGLIAGGAVLVVLLLIALLAGGGGEGGREGGWERGANGGGNGEKNEGLDGVWISATLQREQSPEAPFAYTFSGTSFTSRSFAVLPSGAMEGREYYEKQEQWREGGEKGEDPTLNRMPAPFGAVLVEERDGGNSVWEYLTDGTFIIADDKMETSTEDAHRALPFSRTENTITINGHSYTRKK